EQQYDDEVAEAEVVVGELLQYRHEGGGDRGTRERTETADDGDDEREDQQRAAEVGSDAAVVVAREHTADSGRGTTDREDDRERRAHVNTECGDHGAVLDTGTDDESEARVLEERHD